MNELDIFSAAVELTTPEDREKYLDEACGDNEVLRERIKSLLRSSREAGSFIESLAHDAVRRLGRWFADHRRYR